MLPCWHGGSCTSDRSDLRITEDILEEYINERIVIPSRPVLSNKNPQIVPRVRAAGTGKIARRPVR